MPDRVCQSCAMPLPLEEFPYVTHGSRKRRGHVCRLCRNREAVRRLDRDREKILAARARREAQHRQSTERQRMIEERRFAAAGE